MKEGSNNNKGKTNGKKGRIEPYKIMDVKLKNREKDPGRVKLEGNREGQKGGRVPKVSVIFNSPASSVLLVIYINRNTVL